MVLELSIYTLQKELWKHKISPLLQQVSIDVNMYGSSNRVWVEKIVIDHNVFFLFLHALQSIIDTGCNSIMNHMTSQYDRLSLSYTYTHLNAKIDSVSRVNREKNLFHLCEWHFRAYFSLFYELLNSIYNNVVYAQYPSIWI
jgi:hypothetical protein